jgi:hypothetical protein
MLLQSSPIHGRYSASIGDSPIDCREGTRLAQALRRQRKEVSLCSTESKLAVGRRTPVRWVTAALCLGVKQALT